MRRFQLRDLPLILSIERSSFYMDAYSKEDFLQCLKKDPAGFIIAEVEERAAGYVIGHASGGKGYLDSIAVEKNLRGKRIGQKLFDFLINYFKKKKVKEVELEVRVENKKVIKWYKREGFKIVRCLKNYYPDGGDVYLMRKSF